MPGKHDERVDSLMDILFAQCDDLEALLRLARNETAAAEEADFDRILQIVQERAALSDRLEVYHRQLAELRARLGDDATKVLESPIASRTISLVNEIKLQDHRSLPLLIAARSEALEGSLRAEKAKRTLGAYSSTARPDSIACDTLI